MSGGFRPSLKRSDVEISGEAHFLASEHYMVKRAGITLDADSVTADADGNKILKRGTFVTPITASGKYGPYDSGASDGRETAHPDQSGYLPESVNLRDGDVICGLFIHGSVLEARVTPTPVPAAVKTAVAGRITFQ